MFALLELGVGTSDLNDNRLELGSGFGSPLGTNVGDLKGDCDLDLLTWNTLSWFVRFQQLFRMVIETFVEDFRV